MTNDQGAAGADPDGDVVVAHALARVLRETGWTLTSDPRRVQGMVRDVIGEQSRTRRAEVDAVVLAAEESVPDDLISGRIDVAEAMERLRDRGLDAGVALFAVDVWRYALGMLDAEHEPPSLRNSVDAVTDATITDGAPAATALASEVSPNSEGLVVGRTATRGLPAPWLIGAAATVLGLLVVGLVVMALGVGDSDDDLLAAELPTSTTTTVAATTTTTTSTIAPTTSTTVAPTTVPAPSPSIEFDPEVSELGEVVRVWEVDDEEVIGTLTLVNAADTATAGTHYEVFPTSMIPNTEAITAESDAVVIKDASAQGLVRVDAVDDYVVVAWTLEIPADSEYEIVYRLAMEEGLDVTSAHLEDWQTEQLAASEHFAEVRARAPTLTIDTPQGLEITDLPLTITGTVSPDATLSANEYPLAVGDDGSWTVTWYETVPVMFLATSPYGVTTTETFSFTVATRTVATTTTTSPPTQTPNPAPGSDPTTTTTTVTTTTTTTTPGRPEPPVVEPDPTTTTTTTTTTPPPPPLSVSISGPTLVYVGCLYQWSASASEAASYVWSGMFNTSGASFTGSVNHPGQFTLTVTVTASDGRVASRSVTITSQQSDPNSPIQSPGC